MDLSETTNITIRQIVIETEEINHTVSKLESTQLKKIVAEGE